MKYFPTLLLLLIGFLVHSQETNHKPNFSVSLDPSLGKSLLKQCSRARPEHVTSFWLVSQRDIDSMEQSFSSLDTLLAKDCCFISEQSRTLKRYGVQYIGVVIKKRRYIYINAFSYGFMEDMKKYSPNFDPTKTPVVVCDGGSSFWGVLFDIETKQFSSLSFNGIGFNLQAYLKNRILLS